MKDLILLLNVLFLVVVGAALVMIGLSELAQVYPILSWR